MPYHDVVYGTDLAQRVAFHVVRYIRIFICGMCMYDRGECSRYVVCRGYVVAHRDESTHDGDVGVYGYVAVEQSRQHGYALLGKGERIAP